MDLVISFQIYCSRLSDAEQSTPSFTTSSNVPILPTDYVLIVSIGADVGRAHLILSVFYGVPATSSVLPSSLAPPSVFTLAITTTLHVNATVLHPLVDCPHATVVMPLYALPSNEVLPSHALPLTFVVVPPNVTITIFIIMIPLSFYAPLNVYALPPITTVPTPSDVYVPLPYLGQRCTSLGIQATAFLNVQGTISLVGILSRTLDRPVNRLPYPHLPTPTTR